MSKRAEIAASEAYPEETRFIRDYNQLAKRQIYQEGYEQAEKDTIERAIQWLITHADDYIVDMEVSRYKPSKLHVGGMCWEHLKQAMEKE